MKKILTNESGFTLVEILIAAGLLSLLALGFATYMFNTSKMQRRVEVRNNVATLSTQIHATAIDTQSIYNSKYAQPSPSSAIEESNQAPNTLLSQ